MKFSRTSILNVLAILFIFLILAVAYFYPVLEGKRLVANDTSVWKASSKEIVEHREKYHEEPLWTNSMFSGMPAYQVSISHTGNITNAIKRILQIFGIPIAALFLTLAGFFVLLRIFDIKPWLAMIGSIAYAFSSYNFIILAAGHNTKAYAIAYMAPLIAAIILSIRKNRLAGAAITGLLLAIQISANHLQITYYTFIILIIFGISELYFFIKEKKIIDLTKSLAVLIVMAVLAVGANFAPLYTTMEYSDYTTRGGSNLTIGEEEPADKGLDLEYATRWSIGIDETLTLLIPNFKGGETAPFKRDSEIFKILNQYNASNLAPYFQRYWGDQPGTASVYFGAVVIFLFVMGLFFLKGRDKWWLLAATVISIALSWGKNFMPLTSLFFDIVPGYNKFRTVTMIIVIAGLTFPLVGFLGLKELFEGNIPKKKFFTALKWSTGITAGIALFFGLFPGSAGSFISPMDQNIFSQINLPPEIQRAFENALISDRTSMLRTDAFRSFAFIIAAAGLLWAYYSKQIKMRYALGILAVLILFDMWPVDKRYINKDNFQPKSKTTEAYPMTACDAKILKDPTLSYRVLNLSVSPFNDNSTSNYHKSIGGYHGAKLQRYQELIQYGISRDINTIYSASQNTTNPAGFSAIFNGTNSLNMLNTKYIIVNPESDPLINSKALGNAWFVNSVQFVKDSDEEIAMINRFDPKTTVLVDMEYEGLIKNRSYPSTNGSIELTSYKANELTYDYRSSDESFVVFSEIFYPEGWNAYIDGELNDHFRVDYTLRGMVVPAGDHEIVFKFHPRSYYMGNRISLISSVLLLIILAGAIFLQYKYPDKFRGKESELAQDTETNMHK